MPNAFSVADPKPCDADPDPSFHCQTDSDPTFHFDIDHGSYSSSKWCKSATTNLETLTALFWSLAFHSSIMRIYGSWIMILCWSGSSIWLWCRSANDTDPYGSLRIRIRFALIASMQVRFHSTLTQKFRICFGFNTDRDLANNHNVDLYPNPERQKQYGVMRILITYQAFTVPQKIKIYI